MNRRTFLQSLIAVPLVAVGMPRVKPLMFHHDAFLMVMEPLVLDESLLITSGGRGFVYDARRGDLGLTHLDVFDQARVVPTPDGLQRTAFDAAALRNALEHTLVTIERSDTPELRAAYLRGRVTIADGFDWFLAMRER